MPGVHGTAGSGLTATGAPVTLTWWSRRHGGKGGYLVEWSGTVVLRTPRLLLRTFAAMTCRPMRRSPPPPRWRAISGGR